MKRILLHVLLMILTFVLGLALDRLIPKSNVKQIPSAEQPRVASTTAVTSIPIPPTPAVEVQKPILIFDYNQQEIYLGGDFIWLGRPPKEFAEFNSFSLWSASDGEHSSGGLDLFIHSNKASQGTTDVERAVFALVTQRRLFFATSEGKNGYAYRFDGEYLRPNMSTVDEENTPVLRGTLTKMKNGRRVAERSVKFGVIVHGC